ncbi:hypothetical protein GE21DRAFT_2264 [Neurospora crassa]|uniref:Uncharacterized protein n=1 Tax=Neurospora crassa (strain ATCC 24698 / 74-OR23-1A / CBS 708.71 / DSM 1257 / FGSC 987) TaxID=367110 RepID=V5IQA0_NEUCR|nr:hypothetical protein NCU16463 [Neurospora crassa OR74A]ESA44343.1 hypothetical protein NCU16463 [Neurospora crassa OR74A]KHE79941.1 hypothetical protein GE21DRAFT_2264 [Neurospora crassa]|eukprot:XP_011393429.1 hypothetical protein NCU16463 [Neurospora crassa OR74A]
MAKEIKIATSFSGSNRIAVYNAILLTNWSSTRIHVRRSFISRPGINHAVLFAPTTSPDCTSWCTTVICSSDTHTWEKAEGMLIKFQHAKNRANCSQTQTHPEPYQLCFRLLFGLLTKMYTVAPRAHAFRNSHSPPLGSSPESPVQRRVSRSSSTGALQSIHTS